MVKIKCSSNQICNYKICNFFYSLKDKIIFDINKLYLPSIILFISFIIIKFYKDYLFMAYLRIKILFDEILINIFSKVFINKQSKDKFQIVYENDIIKLESIFNSIYKDLKLKLDKKKLNKFFITDFDNKKKLGNNNALNSSPKLISYFIGLKSSVPILL